MRKKTVLGLVITETDFQEIFYPQFCYDCSLPYVSKTETNPCPYCGSENLVDHEREIYKNIKDKVSIPLQMWGTWLCRYGNLY